MSNARYIYLLNKFHIAIRGADFQHTVLLFLLKSNEIISEAMPFSYKNINTELKDIFSFRRYSFSKVYIHIYNFFQFFFLILHDVTT